MKPDFQRVEENAVSPLWSALRESCPRLGSHAECFSQRELFGDGSELPTIAAERRGDRGYQGWDIKSEALG